MSKLVPKYHIWEAINAAIQIGMRALEEIRTLARTPGPRGEPGRDGFGFEDISVVETDKGWMIRFTKGDAVKEFRLPIVTDRGVFRDGTGYRRGDGVSFGGSWFIAQEDTTDRPETTKAWRLAVKRGRDGKDGGSTPPSTPRGPVKVG
jgi:hypothetical protein